MTATAGLVLSAAAGAPPAAAGTATPEPPSITVTELVGPGGVPMSSAELINERGVVVGTVPVTQRFTNPPAVWRVGGEVTELGTLGGERSAGAAINERGQVAGVSETASGEPHLFLWSDGEMVDLGTLGGASSHATAVNNRGQVVGMSQTASGAWHAVLWDRGRMVDRTAAAGGTSGQASDINDRGQIVGTDVVAGTDGTSANRALLWTASRPWRSP